MLNIWRSIINIIFASIFRSQSNYSFYFSLWKTGCAQTNCVIITSINESNCFKKYLNRTGYVPEIKRYYDADNRQRRLIDESSNCNVLITILKSNKPSWFFNVSSTIFGIFIAFFKRRFIPTFELINHSTGFMMRIKFWGRYCWMKSGPRVQ